MAEEIKNENVEETAEKKTEEVKESKLVSFFKSNKMTIIGTAAGAATSLVIGWIACALFKQEPAEFVSQVVEDVQPEEVIETAVEAATE